MRSYEVSEYDKGLLLQPSITYKIKFEVMDESMQIVNMVEGIVVGGNYSINSTSDVRRSVSITVVPTYFYDTNMVLDPNGYIWLDKVIHLYIGVVDLRTQETKYYSEGYYYYTNVSGVYNTSTNTLSLSLNDFMVGLNGTKNGQLAAWITSIPAYIEDELGRPVTYHIIKDAMAATLSQLSSYVKGYFIEDMGESKGLPRFNTNYESYRKRHRVWNAVPYDLEFGTGDSVLNIITTLRDLYPNFETYFDPVTNDFVCQMIPSLDNDEIVLDNDFLQMVTQSENVSTNFTTVRNICEVWGKVLECDYYADTSYTMDAYELIVRDYQAQINSKLDRLRPLDQQITEKTATLEWVESEQTQKKLDGVRSRLEKAKSDLRDYENQLVKAEGELSEYGKSNMYYFSQYVENWDIMDSPKEWADAVTSTELSISLRQEQLKQAKAAWARLSWGNYRGRENLQEAIDDARAYDLYKRLDFSQILAELTTEVEAKERIRNSQMDELSEVVRNRNNYNNPSLYREEYDRKLAAYERANNEYEYVRQLLGSLNGSIPYLKAQVNTLNAEKAGREQELAYIQSHRDEYHSDESWQSAITSATKSLQSTLDSLRSYDQQLKEAQFNLASTEREITFCEIAIKEATDFLNYLANNQQRIEDEYRQTVQNRYQENILSPLDTIIRQHRVWVNRLQEEYDQLYAAAGYESMQRIQEEKNMLEAERTILEREYWEVFERQRSRIQLLSEADQKDSYAYIAEIDHFPDDYPSGLQVAVRICETNIGRTCYLKVNGLDSVPIFDKNTDHFVEPGTLERGCVYVFQLERHVADGLPDTVAYLLGSWQVHALDILTDGTVGGVWIKKVPIKDGSGNLVYDSKGNIRYEDEVVKDADGNTVYVYSQKYFEIKYDCENVNLTVIEDSPFTVQKLGEIVDVKTGDRFEKIQSDSVARENAIYENWKNSRLTDTITLQTLLIPFADVNTKVSYRPQNETRIKDYVIKSISHNLSSFTSSITMYRYYPLYRNNTVTMAWTAEDDGGDASNWLAYDRNADYTTVSSLDTGRCSALTQFKARYNVAERAVSLSGTITVDLESIFNENPPDAVRDELATFNRGFVLPALATPKRCTYVDTWYGKLFFEDAHVMVDPRDQKLYFNIRPKTDITDTGIGRTKSRYFNMMFKMEYRY